MYTGFTKINLNDLNSLWYGTLPKELIPESDLFFRLWNLHPLQFILLKYLGKLLRLQDCLKNIEPNFVYRIKKENNTLRVLEG